MKVADAKVLINELRKTKYIPTEWECKFLEGISMDVDFGNNGCEFTVKQGDVLQKIYRKAQELVAARKKL